MGGGAEGTGPWLGWGLSSSPSSRTDVLRQTQLGFGFWQPEGFPQLPGGLSCFSQQGAWGPQP